MIGAYLWDPAAGEVKIFFAPAVLLATGGVGNLFLHTSNPPCATGDGLAMASRIGAEILNAEYVQFHPTVLFHRDVKRFLISEALRGEGARLVNHAGERFMKSYDPERADLAPRDEVSRAMYREMENEGSDYLLLDARARRRLPAGGALPRHLRDLHERRAGHPARSRSPSCPRRTTSAAGSRSGSPGRTSVPGLYAAGETACTGVHGANRLASVSLLEGLYFGHAAGHGCRAEPRPRLRGAAAEHPRLGLPLADGGVRPGAHPAGHAEHPVHDVELRRHHPQRRSGWSARWRTSTTSATGSRSSTARQR